MFKTRLVRKFGRITGTPGTGDNLVKLDPGALSKAVKPDPVKVKFKNVHYVSCPIFYATSSPHIGHIHTAIIGDFFHRWHQLHGVKSVLSLGTDEHGQKIIRTANQLGYDHPQNLVDEITREYSSAFKKFNVAMHKADGAFYIRTSWEAHHKVAQLFWKRIRKDIHLEEYGGWYSTPDESFIAAKDREEKDGKVYNINNGHQLEYISETNYVFEFGQYLDQIEEWAKIAINEPAAVLHEIQERRKEGRTKLSISRPRKRVKWGVVVPDDPEHTMYVWFEALINYLTAGDFNGSEVNFWPPQVQIMGSDIDRFHCIYWPAMLLAADLELPRKIFIHGHWTRNGTKMSKSLNNFVTPEDLLEAVGNQGDAVRWFCLKHAKGGPHNSDFQEEVLRVSSDVDFANKLGNLLARSTGKMNPSGGYPVFYPEHMPRMESGEMYLVDAVQQLPELYADLIDAGKITNAMKLLISTVQLGLELLTNEKIYRLDRSDLQERMRADSSIHACFELLRVVSILLQPAAPTIAGKVLNRLGIPLESRMYADACDSFSALDGEQFERVGRLLGPQQGHLFKPSRTVKQELAEAAKVKAHQLAVYEKKHPTEELVGQQPGDSESLRAHKRKVRREKSAEKFATLKKERQKNLPLHLQDGVMSRGEYMADAFDDDDQHPAHFHPEPED